MKDNMKLIMWAVGIFIMMSMAVAGGYFSRSLSFTAELASKASHIQVLSSAKELREEFRGDMLELKKDIKEDLTEIKDDLKDLIRSLRR